MILEEGEASAPKVPETSPAAEPELPVEEPQAEVEPSNAAAAHCHAHLPVAEWWLGLLAMSRSRASDLQANLK